MRILFLLAMAFVFVHDAADAQTRRVCDYGPAPCEAYATADAVFIGTVTKIVPATFRMGQTDDDYDQTAYVSVEKIYKGYRGRRIVLRQLGRRHAQKFVQGSRYLFYANHDRAARLWEVRPCGRTLMAEYAQIDLRYIEGLPANAVRTHVGGMIARYDPDASAEYAGAERLVGIKVKVIGEDRGYETVTDANGQYEFYDLPPGPYRIEARVPNGLVLFGALHSGPDPLARARDLEFALNEHGCAEVTLLFMSDKMLKKEGSPIGRAAPRALPRSGTLRIPSK